jgi:hypothetical protein
VPVTPRPSAATMDGGQGGEALATGRHGLSAPRAWNEACTPSPAMRSKLRYCALSLAIVGAFACDPGDDGDEVELAVADRSANAVTNKTNLALLAEFFAADPVLSGTTVEQARAGAVALLVARLDVINFKECTPQVTSDSVAGRVTASFTGCRVGLLAVEGDAEATVQIETTPCARGECPSAVVWTLPDFDVVVGPAGVSRPQFNGVIVLRDPIQAAGEPELPMSWTTEPGFTITNRLGVFETISHASWTVDAQRCVQMQLEARIERVDTDDAIDRHIRTIVVSVDGLRRCPAHCPERGRVRIAFGRGALLEWSYDEGGEVEVDAPRGRRFAQTLACRE